MVASFGHGGGGATLNVRRSLDVISVYTVAGTSNGGSAPSATMNAYPTPLTSPRTTTTVSSMLTPRSAAGNNAQAGNGKENFITNGVKNGTIKMSKGFADLKKGVKNLFTPTLF